MHKKTRLALVLSAAVAPIIAVTLPAPAASAHGWINSPASRQDQCKTGVVSCGEIKWEPQSVEGPKGLKSCNGGLARFSDLNDDGKGWRRSNVGVNQTFNWTLTARHRTTTWQYFVGNTKVAEFNDGGATPGATVSHNVNFGSIRGNQKVLAVWNIADTPMAFYSCIDVKIG
ncbi:lytic polysaccharide monooxygenase auxiliary activity family 9 protein [Streptomyces sp. NPDC058653]|uniref:lytic polysaccharide monooxygenase auxiliary activity family 9 protein n=1 Tax=Streptomyces sp. NPDC058653 TaxID=3346576 RepID=UPI003658F11F